MQGSEPSSCLSFFCIFEKSGKNKATDLAVRGSTIAIISAMDKASTYRPVLARARVQVIQSSGSWMVVFRFVTLSV